MAPSYPHKMFGNEGFDHISSGSEAGTWYALQVVGGNANIDATSIAGDSLSGVNLLDGAVIFGRFSGVTINSGAVLAYREGDVS